MSQYILGVLKSCYSFKLAISNMPNVFFSLLKPTASHMLVKLSTTQLHSQLYMPSILTIIKQAFQRCCFRQHMNKENHLYIQRTIETGNKSVMGQGRWLECVQSHWEVFTERSYLSDGRERGQKPVAIWQESLIGVGNIKCKGPRRECLVLCGPVGKNSGR